MPLCPRCNSEYAEEATSCPTCSAARLGEPPALHKGNRGPEFMGICRAGDETEAQVIRGALEANGIDCALRGESLRLTHAITADGLAEVAVFVRREDVDRAREVIARARGTTS